MRRRPCRAPRSSPTSPKARRRRSTVTWPRRCSMARKRVSMREGPLAELFRATEAAQDRSKGRGGGRGRKPEDTGQTEILSVVPESEPQAPPAEASHGEEPPVARWLEPLPENPARLERPRDSASYLAVIRVVGVGGAGLNALDRMIDAGITQVDFIAVNTDIQQLQMSDTPTKIHIGSELTEGLGSGA